jgi:hypothetical protein
MGQNRININIEEAGHKQLRLDISYFQRGN